MWVYQVGCIHKFELRWMWELVYTWVGILLDWGKSNWDLKVKNNLKIKNNGKNRNYFCTNLITIFGLNFSFQLKWPSYRAKLKRSSKQSVNIYWYFVFFVNRALIRHWGHGFMSKLLDILRQGKRPRKCIEEVM